MKRSKEAALMEAALVEEDQLLLDLIDTMKEEVQNLTAGLTHDGKPVPALGSSGGPEEAD